MTKQEQKQDGMCYECADNVWEEISISSEHYWTHTNEEDKI